MSITLNQPLTSDQLARSSFSFNLIATHNDVADGQTTIVLDVTRISSPIFVRSFYQGTIARDLTINLDDITITEATYTSEIVFSLDTGMLYFILVFFAILIT